MLFDLKVIEDHRENQVENIRKMNSLNSKPVKKEEPDLPPDDMSEELVENDEAAVDQDELHFPDSMLMPNDQDSEAGPS